MTTKKSAATVKPAKAAAKPTKAVASKCACPYCDEELTADKTPLFCTPCITAAKRPVKKQTGKVSSAKKTA